MIVDKTPRGFEIIRYGDSYLPDNNPRLVQQSSAIGNYEDSMGRPGSSFLWIGEHKLDREDVAELVEHLQAWLKTGSLEIEASGRMR